jgi:GH15 family glucan-1,4-alpha-glucosidase
MTLPFDAASAACVDAADALDIDAEERASLLLLARRSHHVITQNQRPEGAYPAAPTFSAYAGYAWLRDGSFTAEGISRYGDANSANRFHGWADRVLTSRRGQVAALLAASARGDAVPIEAMLPTRFTYAGADGSEPWWDFQTDGYGMWLWSAVTHAVRHNVDLERWRGGLELATDYLSTFWDRPCYDWWEEHVEQRHVSTLGAIHGGLATIAGSGLLDTVRSARAVEVAGRIKDLVRIHGVADGHLSKWLGNSAVDGSLAACVVPFGLVDRADPLAGATLAAVARDLDADGGVHRYRADVFYGGGQWVLLAALLGWNLAARGDRAGALRHLRWIAAQATEEGDLPEQVAGHLLHPDTRAEWVARWGAVASPLLWSQAMYLILADELGVTDNHRGLPT